MKKKYLVSSGDHSGYFQTKKETLIFLELLLNKKSIRYVFIDKLK